MKPDKKREIFADLGHMKGRWNCSK